jgi:hypothetical protein
MKNFQYSVFEFFVIAIFVCHFVYLATSSDDLKITIIEIIDKNTSNMKLKLVSQGRGFCKFRAGALSVV